MAAKNKTTSRVSSAFNEKDRPTPAAARTAAGEITGDKKDGRGRPKATHGLTRTSVLADKDQMQRLKIEAAKEGRHMYELLSEAIDLYLEQKR